MGRVRLILVLGMEGITSLAATANRFNPRSLRARDEICLPFASAAASARLAAQLLRFLDRSMHGYLQNLKP